MSLIDYCVESEKQNGCLGTEWLWVYSFFVFFFFNVCVFLRPHSQHRHMEVPRLGGWIRAIAGGHSHSHRQQGFPAAFAHGNAGSLTHWVRPGIKPVSSWVPVRFISAESQWELLYLFFFFFLTLMILQLPRSSGYFAVAQHQEREYCVTPS